MPCVAFCPALSSLERTEELYDRHAANLYWQALFTLDDCAMAEQVVGDVLVEECVRPGAAICGQDSRGRLAVAAYRRCMELTGSPPARSPRAPACRTAGCAGPVGLTARERGVLGLVLFGGLGHRQAGPDLGISASDTAALPRAAVGNAAAAMSRSSRPSTKASSDAT